MLTESTWLGMGPRAAVLASPLWQGREVQHGRKTMASLMSKPNIVSPKDITTHLAQRNCQDEPFTTARQPLKGDNRSALLSHALCKSLRRQL